MDAEAGLAETEDRWILPLTGQQVTQIQIDYRLALLLDSGALITIETAAVLVDDAPGSSAATTPLEPGDQDVVPALALFGSTVTSAVAFKTGELEVRFGSGLSLRADPDPHYEAWQIRGQAGLLLVCQPGGSVAVWS